jgi:hypothetical protein
MRRCCKGSTLETDSDKAESYGSDKNIDTDMDRDTDRGHDEDCCCKWEPSPYLVKTTGHLEFL